MLLRQKNLKVELELLHELFVGLVALLILCNTHVINRRLEFSKTRKTLISMAVQSGRLVATRAGSRMSSIPSFPFRAIICYRSRKSGHISGAHEMTDSGVGAGCLYVAPITPAEPAWSSMRILLLLANLLRNSYIRER